MRILTTNVHGELRRKDLIHFGGAYSFWDKLKLGGTGSPKVVYESGLEAFDAQKRHTSGEIGFINFEIMKDGLILRLNMNQRLFSVGFKLSEIEKINFTAFTIDINNSLLNPGKEKIVNRGEIEIVTPEHRIEFAVIVKQFKGITQFFMKKELVQKFKFQKSNNPPTKDFSYLIDMLEMFDYL